MLVIGIACNREQTDTCAGLGELCSEDSRVRQVAARVDDVVSIDLDGDGEEEIIAITRDAHQLALGHRSGWRSVVFLDEGPVALAGLPGEVAVALSEPPTVAIFGVDPTGRLERRRDLALDAAPGDLWSGDLDGDGRPELLVAHPGAGQLTRLDPDTGTARTFTAGEAPVAIDVADLDGDTVADIVVVDQARAALQLLRGAGGGEFQPARELPGVAPADSLALADHDGDGDVDVLTRGATPSVTLHRNDGDGEFAPPVDLTFSKPFPTGTGLVVGPAGPDGTAGVSVPQGKALTTWLGDGTSWLGRVEEHLFNPATWIGGVTDGLLVGGEGFVSRLRYATTMTPFELWRDSSVRGDHGAAALAIGDLDGDGLLDFAAAGRDDLTIFLGADDGGFTKSTTLHLGGTPNHLVIAEFTGDAHLNILLSDDETVRLAQGDNGNFALRPAYVPAVPPLSLTELRTGAGTPTSAVAIPHNVYSMFYEPILGVALLRFGEDGQVAEEVPLAGDLAVQRLVAVDVDDDGADEPLLFARRDGVPVLTRMTPVDGSFASGPEHDVSALSGIPPDKFGYARLAAGDPDGDGVPEAWLGSFVEGTLRIFELENESPTVIVDPEAIPATHFRDIDGDGHLDAVAVDTNSFWYQRGRGDGTFDAQDPGYSFPGGDAIALAPGPGAQFDLVSLSDKGVSTHRLRNAARPVQEEDDFNFHGPAAEFVTADIDQDGHTDVVTLCRDWGGGIQVLWGDATGALARADGFNGTLDNRGLAVGDLDGDGFPEVIASTTISWIEAYRFWPQREEEWLGLPLDTLLQIEDLAIADVDADGVPDILALAYNEFYDNPGMRLYVAHGEGLFDFGDWTHALSLPGVRKATVEVGDVDGEGHLDFLVRPADETSAGALVLATGARTWAEPLMLPGQAAAFTAVDADGRVDLVIHDGSTIARHADGQPDQREVLVRDPALVGSLLRRVADVDGDGRHDLLVETLTGTDVWLHGDAGYHPVLTVPRDVMEAIDVADIDGDHRPDLVGLLEGHVVVRLAAPA